MRLTSSSYPIAIFDSGVGGLSVAKALKKRLPFESTIYLADTASSPFGTKSESELKNILTKNICLLKELQIKMLIIACHTACSVGLDFFSSLNVPVAGVSESMKSILKNLDPGVNITVLATNRTIFSGLYQKELSYKDPSQLFFLPCSDLVNLIESLCQDPEAIKKTLSSLFSPIFGKKNNHVLLGCTHFPLYREHIKESLESATLIDPAQLFANHIANDLEKKNLLSKERSAEHHFLVTEDIESFKKKFDYYVKEDFENSRTFFNQTCGMI